MDRYLLNVTKYPCVSTQKLKSRFIGNTSLLPTKVIVIILYCSGGSIYCSKKRNKMYENRKAGIKFSFEL